MNETTLKTANPNLIRLLEAHRVATGRTLEQLAEDFGYSATTLCKYLKGSFGGNLERLEHALETGLRHYAERERTASNRFRSHAVMQVEALGNKLKKESWMGVGFGDAGVGKTCGADKLLLKDLSATLVTVISYRRDRNGLMQVLWEQAGNGEKKPPRGLSKMDYLERVYRNSGRLLIVDQAHLLNKMGRQFFCDFSDRTNLAILFLGNPEMFTAWQELEQQYSRLRLFEKIKMEASGTQADRSRGCDTETAVEEMLKRHAAGGEDELRGRAIRVARGGGHLRSLETSLKLASTIRDATRASWADAFDAAESQQVRNYK